ncbi:uncharacterized protein LOC143282646 isoform X2 [Babylonia areolata]|uniref:uncharacterized protein LOC143282646 isoform X2 n=1 Tax=Babylonia areolata TaxID=304850 RepID=UPI003FD563DC
MAAVSAADGVNYPRRAMPVVTPTFFWVLLCCAGLFSHTDGVWATAAFPLLADSCSTGIFNLSTTDPPQSFPKDLQLANKSYVIFDVRACSDAHVVLHSFEVKPKPKASVFVVVLGKDNQSESVLQDCSDSPCSVKKTEQINPLDCDNFTSLALTWGNGGLSVFRHENDTWRSFLNFSATEPLTWNVQSVFVDYEGTNGTSEWRLEDGCHKEAAEGGSVVSQGRFAGGVTVALLVGIIFGALCAIYGPRLFNFIRGKLEALTAGRTGGGGGGGGGGDAARTAGEEEELTALVGTTTTTGGVPSSPEDKKAATQTTESTTVDLTLPGDNPPPPTTTTSTTGRKASNAYTPYHQMGGSSSSPSAAKPQQQQKNQKDDVTPTKPDSAPKTSGSSGGGAAPERTTSPPLPALPGDDVVEAAAAPDDVYVNTDVHVYEGVRQEAPIYENRGINVYEPLKPPMKSAAKKK